MTSADLAKIVVTQTVLTVFALIVGYVKLRQDIRSSIQKALHTRRLDRLQKQLAEFYGPLHMLAMANEKIGELAWGKDIWPKVFADAIVPTQLQMESILLEKISLLDGTEIPESYYDFLKHVRLVRCYKDEGLNVSYFEKSEPYPMQFNKDIAADYQRKKEEYLTALGD